MTSRGYHMVQNQGLGAEVGAGAPGAGAGTILIFLQEPEWSPEHFKKSEWSRS